MSLGSPSLLLAALRPSTSPRSRVGCTHRFERDSGKYYFIFKIINKIKTIVIRVMIRESCTAVSHTTAVAHSNIK